MDTYQISKEMLAEVSAKVAHHYSVLPIERRGESLRLLTPKGISMVHQEELRVVLGKQLEFVGCDLSELNRLIQEHYGIGAKVIETLAKEHEKESSLIDFEQIDAEGDDLTVIRLVNDILVDAIKHDASDVHIEPFEDYLRVRYRVDGILIEAKVSEQIKYLAATLISRIKIMANLDIGEKRLPQDGRIKVKLQARELDLRVSLLPSSYGEAIVIRILKSLALLNLEDLGFYAEDLESIQNQISKPHGLILVTGPTGSGKTTTLYAFLKELNKIERKIITIEDPVEYKLGGILQMQVHAKIGFTFVKALRSILRHDPDTIMVGEIRDKETAEIAVRSALTGHLVFSTLHTNDAASAPARLIEMGVEPYLVASSLELVMAQRLVRKLSQDGQSFKGRSVVYEIMPVSEALRELIADRSPASVLRKQALEEGMRTMEGVAEKKVEAGVTSIEEIRRNVKST